VSKVPIRSEYTIEQFEKAFQKLTHSIPRFLKVKCEDFTVTFYYDEEDKPRKISVAVHKKTGRKNQWGDEEVDWWGFTIEKKLYCETPHSTKIDFGPYPGVEEKVKQFIEKIMDSVKPEPRFSLAKLVKSNRNSP